MSSGCCKLFRAVEAGIPVADNSGMMRLAGAFAISILVVGCGVGDPSTDPGPDKNPLGRQCTTTFMTHGTFAPDTANPPPLDPNTNMPQEGCWPFGVWTFT